VSADRRIFKVNSNGGALPRRRYAKNRLEEIKHQPEPVLREVLHYLKFLERQRQEEA